MQDPPLRLPLTLVLSHTYAPAPLMGWLPRVSAPVVPCQPNPLSSFQRPRMVDFSSLPGANDGAFPRRDAAALAPQLAS